ncbi:hypothetical protein QUF72_22305 [Desulfobacterales bacterium HSG2]|nr:hypothetical protein [Desulfobacterales bacterium HSG2]
MIFVWAASLGFASLGLDSLGLDWQIQAPGFANPAGAECGGWPKRRSRRQDGSGTDRDIAGARNIFYGLWQIHPQVLSVQS